MSTTYQTVSVSTQDASATQANYQSEGNGLWFMFALLYFVPSIIAFKRGHHNRAAITGLNLMLGWSVLGWIAAFVWSLTAVNTGSKA